MVKQLAHAFEKDPFYQTVFKNKEQLSVWFEFLLKYGRKKGIIIENDYGIAIISKGRPKNRDMICFGVLKVFFKLGVKRTRLLLRILFLWEKSHKKVNSNHLYLMILAVFPEFQGKKRGSELLEEVKQLCIKLNKPCYLETVTEKNARFYQKNGFQMMETNHFEHYFKNWYFVFYPSGNS